MVSDTGFHFRIIIFAMLVLWATLTTASPPAPAQRIVALSPHLVELVFAAGAGKQLVGVVEYADYPPEAAHLTSVGNYQHINKEQLMKLRPDLVLGWKTGNNAQDLHWIQQQFHLEITEPTHLASIADTIERIGQLAGTQAVASREADRIRNLLADLKARYRSDSGNKPIPVFLHIYGSGLYTVNGEHIISEALELCGARNIFADLPLLAAPVSIESILVKNPGAIVAAVPQGLLSSWKEYWQKWPELAAVQQGRLLGYNADFLSRPTPRMIQLLPRLCDDLNQSSLD